MGYFFHKEDAEVVRIEGEAPRTLYTCIEPKTVDTEHFSMGLEEIDPHSEIPWHSHADAEEIIFVFGGQGVGYVADEVADLKPGTVIYLRQRSSTALSIQATCRSGLRGHFRPPALRRKFGKLLMDLLGWKSLVKQKMQTLMRDSSY